MDIDRIRANVRLHIETARDMDVNRFVSTALTKINETGFHRLVKVTVASIGEGVDADPANRTEGQSGNYYPLLDTLVLPSSILSVTSVFYNGVRVEKATAQDYALDTMPSMSYIFIGAGELRFSFDLTDGDEITIEGRVAVRNIAMLPDDYEEWLMSHVLAGPYLMRQYRDNDLFKYYEMQRERSWRACKGRIQHKDDYITRNGILE